MSLGATRLRSRDCAAATVLADLIVVRRQDPDALRDHNRVRRQRVLGYLGRA